MGKNDQQTDDKNSRRRQLNIIYFIDSARTRSLSIPLGRLKLVGFALFVLMTWSAASGAALVWLEKGRIDLAGRLTASLATIFEYESRYDRVYETAYPPEGRIPKTAPRAPEPKAVAAETPAAPPEQASESDALASAATAAAPEGRANSGDETAAAAPDAEASPAEKPAPGANVSVTNPVLEPRSKELELRFDLTNNSAKSRAEGYVWAVAEFKTDNGGTIYLGAPPEINVNETGDPKRPEKSALFGIKHFKRKNFTFPFTEDQPGTFVGIRIGVMDKSGAAKTTYNVPVEIRVNGKGT